MKQTKHRTKRRKFVPCMVIGAIIYLVFWYASVFKILDFGELGLLETIMLTCPAVALAIVGTGVLLFSSKQIVRIVSDGKTLEFSFYGGKQLRLDKNEITEMTRYAHRYAFGLRNGKRLSAFLYVPPRPLTHSHEMEETIEALSKDGVLPPITWDGGYGGWR